ncbi:MAG: GTP 3',8-cyclase MoaA [Cyclobacteriaceae bacterium]|nr:GTP 3',8-cyclase MoaA [Cyclobacteriaceae bacterium]
MAEQLFDNHGRPLTYLRLAVTDRCNLRCFYCMPEEGIHYLPKKELLTFEEIQRLVTLLASMGISKVRITGGEPFVRTDLMHLLRMIRATPGIESLRLTTNGLLTAPHVKELKHLGIRSINLSLDSLDRQRFRAITRRDEFDATWQTLTQLVDEGFDVKINAVVMEGKNIEDLVPFVHLTEQWPVSVRFIEEMPFNGAGHVSTLVWTHQRILDHLRQHFPSLTKDIDEPHSTAFHYRVPGHRGNIGIIAAYTRMFCGSCNRIRITAQGVLKTCLYDDGVLNIKTRLREGATDDELRAHLLNAFAHRAKDGFEAERQRANGITESMSTIGG